MSRFSRYDTDEERLPEGMTRIGYDADEEVYTFRDADGSIWESAPGNQYGQLTRVGNGAGESYGDDDEETQGFLPSQPVTPERSWRHEMMPLLNFGLIIGLFLLGLWWFLQGTSSPKKGTVKTCPEGSTIYSVKTGDSCWAIGDERHISVDDIVGLNPGLNCDKLIAGSKLCLPDS